jgi:hypothetical protein
MKVRMIDVGGELWCELAKCNAYEHACYADPISKERVHNNQAPVLIDLTFIGVTRRHRMSSRE